MLRKPHDNRTESKLMKITDKLIVVNPLQAAKLALPLFGGVEAATDVEESSATESNTDSVSDAGTEPDSDSTSTTENLTKNPEAIADLLKQLNDATKTIKDLQGKTASYEKEKTMAARAQQTREEQLEQDLTEAQQTIAKMDSVIRHTALINSIQGMKDYEFHSARHVLNELDPNAFEIDVDLENGSATITGIEGEIKRVAKEMPWLVAQSKSSNGTPKNSIPRSSGAPPANPNGDADKVSRRNELMKKFPVISHGRAAR